MHFVNLRRENTELLGDEGLKPLRQHYTRIFLEGRQPFSEESVPSKVPGVFISLFGLAIVVAGVWRRSHLEVAEAVVMGVMAIGILLIGIVNYVGFYHDRVKRINGWLHISIPPTTTMQLEYILGLTLDERELEVAGTLIKDRFEGELHELITVSKTLS